MFNQADAKARAATAAFVAAALALGGCGASDSRTTRAERQAEQQAGDPAYVFAQIVALRDSDLIDVIEPRFLGEALPNHMSKARTGDGALVEHHFSDVVAVGGVTDVRPGDGVVYPNDPKDTSGNDEESRVVAFDDPAAAERNVLVTVELEASSGEKIDAESLTFRMGVLMDANPAEFLAGLRGLDEIAVVLTRIEDGRDKGELVPAMSGALLGQVEGDTVSFPGLGKDQTEFLGGVDTVDELIEAAGAPPSIGFIAQ